MKYYHIPFQSVGVDAEVACFEVENATKEWHIMLHVDAKDGGFCSQHAALCHAEKALLQEDALRGAKILFKRYFLSDIINQTALMAQQKETEGVAVSPIGQAPLDGSKLGVWMYCNSVGTTHNNYQHVFSTQLLNAEGNSEEQSESILKNYETLLKEKGLSMRDDCIRTWFFVRDVDTQYAGMVKARREFFEKQGLTAETHYLASTGIGGFPKNTKAIVQMDAYAVKGLDKKQQQYLYATDFLNPTYEYGVTFERGTVVKYGDRNHIFISGTASINNHGEVVHVGSIEQQTIRMLENVQALLKEAQSSFDDVAQMIVYVRDIADYKVVHNLFEEKFHNIPKIITLAPVCRPAWLIEMECIAIKKQENFSFKPL